jgi:hypothetical protein
MLLDTSGLLCLIHRDEQFHAEACHAYHEAHNRLTHGYVLAEFIAIAQVRGVPRLDALTFILDLVANPDILTVWVDESKLLA